MVAQGTWVKVRVCYILVTIGFSIEIVQVIYNSTANPRNILAVLEQILELLVCHFVVLFKYHIDAITSKLTRLSTKPSRTITCWLIGHYYWVGLLQKNR